MSESEKPENTNPTALFEFENQRLAKSLKPGQEITPEVAEKLEVKDILFIGNSKLKPTDFSLRSLDFQSIDQLKFPGKSAMLDFLRLAQQGYITKSQRNEVTRRTFGKEQAGRLDYVFTASISNLYSEGFKIFYAPVKTNGLHIRIVYGQHLNLQYPVLGNFPETPRFALEKLAHVWRRLKRSEN